MTITLLMNDTARAHTSTNTKDHDFHIFKELMDIYRDESYCRTMQHDNFG